MPSDSAVNIMPVLQRILASGATMPAIGMGTFGSDHASPETVASAVEYGLSIGYRHIDCASVYGNEAQIGGVLRNALTNGMAREELFVTSKLWNDKHAERDIIPSCEQSLHDLGLSYLDLYLVHWPFPNFHPPFCDVSVRSPDARPYLHGDFMRTWREMERLVHLGLVRHIGTSNMTVPKLKLLLRDAAIAPAVNQMELHPHFQQPALFEFLKAHRIEPVAYSPLGSPARPSRDRTPDDTSDLEDFTILEVARRLSVHPAAVCLKWAVARGQTPIPFATNPRHIASNLQAITDPPLSQADTAAIERIDRNCRLIKGQVFLWKAGQSWRDLWDENGFVTPP